MKLRYIGSRSEVAKLEEYILAISSHTIFVSIINADSLRRPNLE